MKYKDTSHVNQQKPFDGNRGPVYGEKGSDKKALGTNAKSFDQKNATFCNSKGLETDCSHTLLDHVCDDTGEVTSFTKDKHDQLVEKMDTDKLITERYMLLASVRHLMPFSRTAKCNRLTRSGNDITVLKNIEFNSINFSGLQTCGSPWTCPWCSSKISERRKNEVVQALESHLSNKGSLYFITLTFRHTKEQDLKELRQKQTKALGYLRASKTYRKYKKLIGYSGLIRALEVTWGQSNGWHPHTHEIVFADNKVSFQSIKRLLFPSWVDACEKAGLAAPSFRRGVDVCGGEKAGDYVSKYGNELTKSHFKKATGDRFSPFDLLRSYFYDDVKLHGAKFVDFADGMNGSRQLYWTNGLKARFDITDKIDKDLADEVQELAVSLGNIEVDKWRAIVKYKAMSTLRIMFKSHESHIVFQYVNDLYVKYLSSGDKALDDKRIADNREKYKAVKAKPEHSEFLTKDKRDVFEKLNESIDIAKARLYFSPESDVDLLAQDIKLKIIRKEKNKDFLKDNYKSKKG